jgi:hypothetical protein
MGLWIPATRPTRAIYCLIACAFWLETVCQPRRRHAFLNPGYKITRLCPPRNIFNVADMPKRESLVERAGNLPSEIAQLPAHRFYVLSGCLRYNFDLGLVLERGKMSPNDWIFRERQQSRPMEVPKCWHPTRVPRSQRFCSTTGTSLHSPRLSSF